MNTAIEVLEYEFKQHIKEARHYRFYAKHFNDKSEWASSCYNSAFKHLRKAKEIKVALEKLIVN